MVEKTISPEWPRMRAANEMGRRRARFKGKASALAQSAASILFPNNVLAQELLSATCRSHPHFPELKKFLDFWARSLDGPLHGVTVAHAQLLKPAEMRLVNGEFRVH